MLLDILGYILIGLFSILGIIVMVWAGALAVSLPIAIIGAILEDLGIIKNS
ncbi:hypothetical protein LEQ04_08460 [Riemerella anatipestifer]|uniref:hypothetical protein n=1 Tax=Riemerella anatipestifer TaxID=34085 RepID=UPI00129D355E|nr:hypothetical protein [Riemerella anatipestifer]WPC10738.1 hypothetical protein LEQ05_12855 [Riemerella anatipestifer]WPC13613.1 hypothetical protein LEQ03_02815 [Riemerella anatipestifer]WPC14611.1 hypothetical protein LEQ04_08460 [Riemerella anatipestifer]